MKRVQNTASSVPPPNALSYRVNDACSLVGIGRTKLYELAKVKKIKLIKIAGRTLVDGNSLRTLVTDAT